MRRLTRTALALLASGALALGVTSCASAPGASGSPVASTARLDGSITVFAAASLKGTFTELATRFEAAHPGTSIVLNFAGSSDLVTQIVEGAPADVFASADTKNMTKLTDADLVEGKPVDVATNVLTIAVPPGNPAKITAFADLAKPGVLTVVCAPQVPCGAATVAVETATGVTLHPASEEASVTDVLGKVSSGQADAGLVYVTDVKAAGERVEGIEFDESSDAVNTYPIATLKASANPEVAAAFSEYVTGTVGRSVLKEAGFGKP